MLNTPGFFYSICIGKMQLSAIPMARKEEAQLNIRGNVIVPQNHQLRIWEEIYAAKSYDV